MTFANQSMFRINSVRMSAVDFARTHEVLEQGLRDLVAPGFVAGFWSAQAPEICYLAHCGNRRNELAGLSALPIEQNTVFDLASVSKVYVASTLTALAVERGWITWDTRVAKLLPELSGSSITLEHLLSHTAGYIAWKPFWEELRAEFGVSDSDLLWKMNPSDRAAVMRKKVLEVKPDVAPGERVLYTDVGYLILGYALEALFLERLDQIAQSHIFSPLGLSSSRYQEVNQSVSGGRIEGMAATENCSWRAGVVQGQVHDDNCWAMGGIAAHAGVFANAHDVLQWASAWLRGWISPSVRAEAWSRMRLPPGCERARGWDTVSGEDSSAGHYFSKNSVGHLGFTGTSIWIDPDAGLAVTLLSNRVHPSRENIKIRAFRRIFHDAIRQDIKEWAK
jgi:CubicO group peptidase (beta-lactamase class C family)